MLAGASLALPALLAAPIANPVTLSSDPTSADAQPGGSATFTITVQNGAIPQSVSFGATVQPSWSYDFAPIGVNLTANGNNSTVLTVNVNASAAVGDYNVSVMASNTLGVASDPLVLVVHVVAPPPAPTPGAPAGPKLSISISPASGDAGSTVEGTLVLHNGDITDLTVTLAARSPSAWAVTFPKGDALKVHPGTTVSWPVDVIIPASAANDTTESITIFATPDSGAATSTTWTVTAFAPASTGAASSPPSSAPSSSNDTSGAASSSGTGSGAGATATGTAPVLETYNVQVTVFPDTVPIAPGETARATVRLSNTGSQALHLDLAGSAADNWPLTFDPASVDVAPGVTRDVAMTLTAPSGIFPGGTGSGSVMVQGNNGLLRTTTFKLSIVPPAAPRDDSKTTTAIAVPPAGGSTLHLTSVQAGLVVGAAAVGVGALVLARARGAREKLVWVGVGLYTRLLKPDVLGHPERDRLYKLVEAQPGVHFHALQRELQWNTGTLTYHLRVLEKHGFIVDRRDGAYRRFYLQGSAPRKELFSKDAPQGLRADVLEAVRNRHGISQGDLALALGANKQTVNYHVKALERAGSLRIEKRGRETFLYPTNAPGLGPGEVPA